MKINKSFSIEDTSFKKFEKICESKSINKSLFIQKAIDKFIAENYEIDISASYKLKNTNDTNYVRIINKSYHTETEKFFINLDNDDKINIDTFDKMYEKVDFEQIKIDNDVRDVLNEIVYGTTKIDDDVEQVDPSFLNNSCISVEKVKNFVDNINTNKINEQNDNDILTINDSLKEYVEKGPFEN
ncbi:hypothetical protein M0Q50_04080 [bacterium]|jgi:hypothetical protein|nr:hypothetical protein [bacterium]